jgi:hypothetical protein
VGQVDPLSAGHPTFSGERPTTVWSLSGPAARSSMKREPLQKAVVQVIDFEPM